MPKFHKEVTIKAPLEKVFKYLDSPTNLPEIWPSLYEVKDVETLPGGGYRFTYLYNMAGRPSRGLMETLTRVLNERIVDQAKGDFESTYAFVFEGHNGTTRVVFDADFETPPFNKELETFIVRWNEYEADAIMRNLKVELVK